MPGAIHYVGVFLVGGRVVLFYMFQYPITCTCMPSPPFVTAN